MVYDVSNQPPLGKRGRRLEVASLITDSVLECIETGCRPRCPLSPVCPCLTRIPLSFLSMHLSIYLLHVVTVPASNTSSSSLLHTSRTLGTYLPSLRKILCIHPICVHNDLLYFYKITSWSPLLWGIKSQPANLSL